MKAFLSRTSKSAFLEVPIGEKLAGLEAAAVAQEEVLQGLAGWALGALGLTGSHGGSGGALRPVEVDTVWLGGPGVGGFIVLPFQGSDTVLEEGDQFGCRSQASYLFDEEGEQFLLLLVGGDQSGDGLFGESCVIQLESAVYFFE